MSGPLRLLSRRSTGRLHSASHVGRCVRIVAVVLAGALALSACWPFTTSGSSSTASPTTSRTATAVPTSTPTNDASTSPSSAQGRIDEAQAAGELTASEATLYRFYLAVADPRLPAHFRPRSGEKVGELSPDALSGWESLPDDVREAINPVLIPPFHAGSWWDLRHTNELAQPARAGVGGLAVRTASYRTSLGPGCGIYQPVLGSWSNVTAAAARVRVWFPKRDPIAKPYAEFVARTLDTSVWPALEGLLGTVPQPDGGSTLPCRGGDDALDVSIVDEDSGIFTMSHAPRCHDTSVFILLPKSATPSSWDESNVAHEFMHAFVAALPTVDGCIASRWMDEALGAWAEDFAIAHDHDHEHAYAYQVMSTTHETFVERGVWARLRRPVRAYGGYLLFQHLVERLGPAVVAEIVRTREQLPDHEAIDEAVPGGWRKQWPLVSSGLWNRDPVADFTNADHLQSVPPAFTAAGLPATGPGSISHALHVAGDGVQRVAVSGAVAPLAVHFYRFVFDDPDARWIAVDPGNYLMDDGYTTDPDASVTALVQTGGVWTAEDWTIREQASFGLEEGVRFFCRDIPAEHVERLVLVVSNSSLDRSLTPQDDRPPSVRSSTAGCAGYRGESHAQSTFVDPGAEDMVPGRMTVDIPEVTWSRPAGARTGASIELEVHGQASWKVEEGPQNYIDGGRCYATGAGVAEVADGSLRLFWDLYDDLVRYDFGFYIRPQDAVVRVRPADDDEWCPATSGMLLYDGGTDARTEVGRSGRLEGVLDTPMTSAAWVLLDRDVIWSFTPHRP
ncbi:hypothetical protein OMK64_03615 [Cellulomonas fimi]|uniref:hypothetical protein n=1 Tax=Cellulomonas fimi TaxID=1708 RepID=UPI00234D9B7E|nr:hypothetical protein [Cellulomonas fimi]MDC7120619.1 hypothetical protein [Cellulomonas fimi]